MPASWLIERWIAVMPRAVGDRLRRRPCSSNDGLPMASFGRPRMSCQCTPVESPSALMSASLAAKRPARERSGIGCAVADLFALGEQALARAPGVRSSARSNRARSTTSTPMPTIMLGVTRP